MHYIRNLHINIIRALVSLLFLYLARRSFVSIYFWISAGYAVFAFAWLALDNIRALRLGAHHALSYIPLVMDVLLVTLFVSLTGQVNSFAVLGYVLIVNFSSSRLERNFGLAAVGLSVGAYLISGLFYIFRIFPVTNIFGYSTSIRPFQLGLSVLALALVLYTSFVFGRRSVEK